MTHLLDTNTCIQLINQGQASPVARRLRMFQPQDIYLCSVVKSELYYGAYRSDRQDRNLATLERFFSQFASLPFDDRASRIAGQIRTQLAASGTPIGPNDLLIAAIALANYFTLVTHNTQEFSRIEGLNLEDWELTP